MDRFVTGMIAFFVVLMDLVGSNSILVGLGEKMGSKRTTRYRVYVDTSVFDGTQDREFKESSLLFFQAVHEGNYQVLISSAVLDELKGAPKSVQDILTSLPERWLELLVEDARAKALANAYLQAGILTKKSHVDALHVATATIARADVIVSWNFKHIVNFDRIRKFNGINLVEGYGAIDIRSPREVINAKEC